MKQFTFTSILIAVAVAAFSLGASNHRTVSASGLADTQGRFQIVQTTVIYTVGTTDEHAPMPFMVDTATGRTWVYEGPMAMPGEKTPIVMPGAWKEADYHYAVMGADGKIHERFSALPVTTK